LVEDNYATHKHPSVQAWLARNPRITMHVNPRRGSWLNMVEIFLRDHHPPSGTTTRCGTCMAQIYLYMAFPPLLPARHSGEAQDMSADTLTARPPNLLGWAALVVVYVV
jgi:hypothetical protein